LALDFDGVLCDSARENAISGWKAGASIWSDMSDPLPPSALIAGYCLARPVIETGHEAILMMRLLKEGYAPADLIENFPARAAKLMADSGANLAELKELYGATRDRWIETNAEEWSMMSPLYPGIEVFLRNLPTSVNGYIITTKEERFVRRLLDYNGIDFPAECIFGLDRGVPKETTLRDLLTRYPDRRLYFVEDRLATLVRVMARADLASVHPRLADWGYNTAADRESARGLNIPILSRAQLLDGGVFSSPP